jgi:hypothetical protein
MKSSAILLFLPQSVTQLCPLIFLQNSASYDSTTESITLAESPKQGEPSSKGKKKKEKHRKRQRPLQKKHKKLQK